MDWCAWQNRAISAASSVSVLLRASSLCRKASTRNRLTILNRMPSPCRTSAKSSLQLPVASMVPIFGPDTKARGQSRISTNLH